MSTQGQNMAATASAIGSIASAVIAGTSMAASAFTAAETDRSVTIEISDFHLDLKLSEPDYYEEAGHCSNPPPGIISPAHKERFQFEKQPITCSGTYGVVGYKLSKVDKNGRVLESDGTRLTIMWGAPWDRNIYDCWHAVGVEGPNTKVDNNLYYKMYNNSGDFARGKAGQPVVYETTVYGIPLKIISSMAPRNHSTINICIE